MASRSELAQDFRVERSGVRSQRGEEDPFADVQVEVVEDHVLLRQRELRHFVGDELVNVGSIAVDRRRVGSAGCRAWKKC